MVNIIVTVFFGKLEDRTRDWNTHGSGQGCWIRKGRKGKRRTHKTTKDGGVKEDDRMFKQGWRKECAGMIQSGNSLQG